MSTPRPWNRGPLAAFDSETSGRDPLSARLVSAALVAPSGQVQRWLSDVGGEEIPAEAARVHGISTEYARAHGRPAKTVVDEVADAVAWVLRVGPLVVMNAPYDLTLLEAECRRHGVPTVRERLGGPVGPIVDPLVLDRATDRYRRGKRTLEALAAHYGVQLEGAHSADADALAALEVARQIAERFPNLQVPAQALHRLQVGWHARWADSFASYLARRGEPADIDGSWPVRGVA
ncbi:3'-5' exonuclease [Streptomyces thermospinosisporus]|uniref:3'-5' exonuclease n=1 Tax=Streptomyces thermospinosisporus TaxID=161482 RepID=A0ABN1Z4N6_9ACTN